MIPDNRIRFDSTKINFDTEVGVTGQTHDTYPAPGQQARYDWMRSFLIGLLSCQSSHSEPTQYRDGTPWFDLNTDTLKIRSAGSWVPLADVIALGSTSLNAWYTNVSATLTDLTPAIVFNGLCTSTSTTSITIPPTVAASVVSTNKAFVYINGILQDPRDCSLASPIIHLLNGVQLVSGDRFTVELKNVSVFYVADVIV